MTAGGRAAVAGACAIAGMLTVWVATRHVAPLASMRRVSATRVVTRGPVARHAVLWLLAIGVSRYQQPSLQLRFADSDARAIASAFEQQRGGPLYADIRTRVLTNTEVTRESILDAMKDLVGQAGPDDVAALFLAGHGVQEYSTGSYYFLPYAATADNLVSSGLRMSDFDEMLRVIRRRVRGVVVLLDTCHAGALQTTSGARLPPPELASSLSAGEGFFLLAATRSGETSEENPALRHGVFTRAVLDGLDGAADSDRDGVVSTSELFGYVARTVPRLTAQQQHPYPRVEGTDLPLAAVRPGNRTPAASSALETVGQIETANPAPAARTLDVNAIAVLEFHNLQGDPQRDWMGNALRVAFNTELSKVTALRVYAPELIDRAVAASGAGHLATAQQMGIGKLVTGSFQILGDTIRIDAQILDTATGTHESSDSVEGNLNEFFELEKRLVLSMLHRLRVRVSPSEGQSIQQDTNTDVDAYRLLLQSEGLLRGATPSPSLAAPQPTPSGPADRRSSGERWTPFAGLAAGAAYAEEPPPDVSGAVHAFLEDYRRALETKDLARLATLYVAFPDEQREIVRAYLDNADQLVIAITDVTVQPQGAEVITSFKRSDKFVDHKTGRSVRLEVRLTKVLRHENGTWRIAP
ncbi:MAG TPA: caspase family protein [Candidatus Kryptonia bacterium]|nr:caspase family protein [Candidatus Kryptonia bacterium]